MSSLQVDYLIVGSGVSGYFALKELLSQNPNVKVCMVTEDRYYPYDRPPLSKEYMRGETGEPFFEGEEAYSGITFLKERKVVDLKEGEAFLDNGNVIKFSKALLSTGGRPRRLNAPGEDLKGVHYLRTLDDAKSIRDGMGKRPVIVGGGFIGVEVASSIARLGLRPIVIEARPYIWSTFVEEKVSRFVQSYLEKRGVTVITGDTVREFQGRGKVEAVRLQGGMTLEASMVLVAVGITPNVEVAQQSGIKVENGIVVDQFLETSMRGVYASGDVANILDPTSGKRKRIEHWNNAEYTGRLAARNMRGGREVYDFLSTVWSDIFDLHIESAGETTDYDDYVLRGKLEEASFVAIYVKGGTVQGYLAVNRPGEELEKLNEAIYNKVNVSNRREILEKGDLGDLTR
ncbi:MAG: FAD-dependent oxidoreductase [Metallosphaera yellowstonensis]|jgi:NAD(P)H-nitrite reductase|uniref:NAD(P)H-nitrite reductase n=1 Tax=Metallosphaera yellowstonensis MK1 TaxID=671065 RepID=H2C4B9_9CREN|nr:FAD-dependent oxidoreductase [Metallosphaera yellowstonensis]EHP69784.1 NAD(P)H-nitrite reductase [Metallosphaera yellowstonensis MK1]